MPFYDSRNKPPRKFSAGPEDGYRPKGRLPKGSKPGDKPVGYGRPDSDRAEGQGRTGGYGKSQAEGRGYGQNRPEGRGRSEGFGQNRSEGRGRSGGFDSNRAEGRGRSDGFSQNRPDNRGRSGGFSPNRPEGRGPSMPRPERRPLPPIAPSAPVEHSFEEDMPRENMLVGRNPIREAIKAGRDLEKLLVARGDLAGSAREIISMAKERHILVQEVDRLRLDALSPHHQGLIAFASAYAYGTIDRMFEVAAERGEDPFLVLLDGVTDPHNLGAIIRSAECAGCHGVIVPERRAVGLTPAAVKASAGAVEHICVARVGNMTRTVDQLKERGVWVSAAMMSGEAYDAVDFSGPVALVIGGEGEGVSRLVAEHCDRRVALPLAGKIESLNASVAAGILMYEVLRRRKA